MGAALPLVMAAPRASAASQSFYAIWSHQKNNATGSVEILVLNKEKTSLLGQSCTDFSSTPIVNTGNSTNNPLSMDVDKNGFGTLSYGGTVYKIHSVPEFSGGIECSMRTMLRSVA
jgi:hypothetical protein